MYLEGSCDIYERPVYQSRILGVFLQSTLYLQAFAFVDSSMGMERRKRTIAKEKAVKIRCIFSHLFNQDISRLCSGLSEEQLLFFF